MLANPQFTRRYVWNGTVHKVVEMTQFTKMTYKCPNVVSFPW